MILHERELLNRLARHSAFTRQISFSKCMFGSAAAESLRAAATRKSAVNVIRAFCETVLCFCVTKVYAPAQKLSSPILEIGRTDFSRSLLMYVILDNGHQSRIT